MVVSLIEQESLFIAIRMTLKYSKIVLLEHPCNCLSTLYRSRPRHTAPTKITGFASARKDNYGVICVSRQRLRPYLLFEASLLANEILSTTRNTSQ